jgi:hypothetical protein
MEDVLRRFHVHLCPQCQRVSECELTDCHEGLRVICSRCLDLAEKKAFFKEVLNGTTR